MAITTARRLRSAATWLDTKATGPRISTPPPPASLEEPPPPAPSHDGWQPIRPRLPGEDDVVDLAFP